MTDQPRVHSWNEPEGVSPRGTLVVLAGRGEHGGVYERFGRRLAADAYRVRALDDPGRAPAATARRVTELLADDASPAPKVLVGADTGALHAVALATRPDTARHLSALVLAGTPTGPGRPREEPAGWEGELELRTACPTHRGRLTGDARFDRGALAAPPPADLADPALDQVTLPVLALHGADDAVSPLPGVRRLYSGFPDLRLVSVAGTRHDVLNDVTHRTAAATVVLFLERLRLSPQLPLIATSETHHEDPVP